MKRKLLAVLLMTTTILTGLPTASVQAETEGEPVVTSETDTKASGEPVNEQVVDEDVHLIMKQEYEVIPVAVGNTIDECDDVLLDYKSIELKINEDNTSTSKVGVFTLDEDSVVNLSIDTAVADNSYWSLVDGVVELFNTKSMTKAIYTSKATTDGFRDINTVAYLPKGTYYLKLTARAYDNNRLGDEIVVDIIAEAIPFDKAVDFKYRVNGKYVEFKCENNILAWQPDVAIKATTDPNSYVDVYLHEDVWSPISLEQLKNKGNSILFRMFGNDSSEFTTGCNTPSRIMKLDLTAPSIKGVKNNKVYKKPITVKFSDASGIKKATLNNKNIKSGTKVSKNGTYTLKVTDKIGNTKKIKFTIK